jgi:uncharacterized damage-inducible protein DinB
MEGKYFIETWDIHNRINLYLLDAIEPEHLKAVSASKGRNVGEQFTHIHNVRLMWLKQAAPELTDKLQKIEKEDATSKQLLQQSITDSGLAINLLLTRSFESGGKIKGFKPHAVAFLGYLISHESHHRGQIALSLKQAGHPLSKKVLFGIWEWGVR